MFPKKIMNTNFKKHNNAVLSVNQKIKAANKKVAP
jgi:hypothetical protein